MALETVTNIADLVITNPTSTDPKSEGDDHIRNIKKALKTDLPNITGPITATQAELNVLDGITASTAELNLLDGVTATTAELNYVDGVTSPIQPQLDGKQPLDADLTAIAGLSSAGIVTRTGAGAASVRTLTAGAGITITNGDGVSGNPAIAINATDLPDSSALLSYTPAGTSAVATTVQTKLRESVSVKDFGAVGDGTTDDTAAIQAAFNFLVSQTSAGLTTSGSFTTSFSGNSPRLYFPKGTYRITSVITIGSYLEVFGDSAIIKQETDSEDIFTCNTYQLKIQGMQFVGGRYQLDIYNANINSTMVEINHCQFFLSRDYAINTRATGGVFTHLSADLSIYKCRFISCNKTLNNCCDSAVLENCWVQPDKQNLTASTAAFLNRGTSVTDPDAFTRLHLKDCFLIPNVGVEGVDRINSVRWIDNYGSFSATHCRFGGENGGMAIVFHLGAPNTTFPWVTTEVIFRDCALFCGPDARTDSCVVGIQGEVPNRVSIRNCSGPVGKPLIANLSSTNLVTYMTNFETNSGKKAYEYFKIDIGDVIYDINAYTPTRTIIPNDLYIFAVKGKQTRLRRAAAQSLSNAFADNFVSFDTVEFDNLSGAFDVATPTRLYMPKGCYKMRISAAISVAVDGAAKTMSATIVTSSLTKLAGHTQLRGINPDVDRMTIELDVEGAPGSYWLINVQHNGAAALNLTDCRVSLTPIDFAG